MSLLLRALRDIGPGEEAGEEGGDLRTGGGGSGSQAAAAHTLHQVVGHSPAHGPDGVAAPDFVYTTGPDDQWRITKAGRYSITFNLKEWTIEAKYLD